MDEQQRIIEQQLAINREILARLANLSDEQNTTALIHLALGAALKVIIDSSPNPAQIRESIAIEWLALSTHPIGADVLPAPALAAAQAVLRTLGVHFPKAAS